MTDVVSETVDDMTKAPLESRLIEIVPLDRLSDDYCKPEFIDPVVEVKPDNLQDKKQEPADDDNKESLCSTVQVRSSCMSRCSYLIIAKELDKFF